MEFVLDEEKEAEEMNDDNNISPIPIEKRRLIIRNVVDFMVQRFGVKPKNYEKLSTAKATVMVFPRLYFKGSKMGGIVSLFWNT